MAAERTDEEIAREIIATARNPCGEYPEDTFGDTLWPREIEALERVIASALRAARAQGMAEGMEEAAKVADLKAQSLRAALTGEPSHIEARVHACVHNLERCAAAIRSLAAERRGKGEREGDSNGE